MYYLSKTVKRESSKLLLYTFMSVEMKKTVRLTMTNIWDISHRQRGHLLHSSLSLRNQHAPVQSNKQAIIYDRGLHHFHKKRLTVFRLKLLIQHFNKSIFCFHKKVSTAEPRRFFFFLKAETKTCHVLFFRNLTQQIQKHDARLFLVSLQETIHNFEARGLKQQTPNSNFSR